MTGSSKSKGSYFNRISFEAKKVRAVTAPVRSKVTVEGEDRSVCVYVTVPENLDDGIACRIEILKNSKLIYSSFCAL